MWLVKNPKGKVITITSATTADGAWVLLWRSQGNRQQQTPSQFRKIREMEGWTAVNSEVKMETGELGGDVRLEMIAVRIANTNVIIHSVEQPDGKWWCVEDHEGRVLNREGKWSKPRKERLLTDLISTPGEERIIFLEKATHGFSTLDEAATFASLRLRNKPLPALKPLHTETSRMKNLEME